MSADATGQVVVTVTSATRRVDLALPSSVPVADLLPDLAARVDLLDADRVHEGHRLLTAAGRLLVAGLGLAEQEVGDGSVLTVLPGVGAAPPPAYDDATEAVTDVVERDLRPVEPAVLRHTAAVVGCLLVGLGVAALAATLPLGSVAMVAAVGSVAAGSVGLVAGAGRVLAIPPATAGTVLLASAGVAQPGALEVARVLSSTLVMVVLAGAALPALAVAAAGLAAEPAEVDADVVAAGTHLGHELLVVGLLVEGVLVAVLAPAAASLGCWGTTLGAGCCLVLLLRARHHRAWPEVLVRAASGTVGLLAVAVTALWLHPGWRLPGALLLAVLGGVVIGLNRRAAQPSVRRGRLAELAETAVLLSLLPLLVPVSGVLPLVRDLVP